MRVGDKEWTKFLISGINKLNLQVNPQQINHFTIHAQELIKWNQRINLTTITDPFEIIDKHIIDSIVPVTHILNNQSILDIGSGGGFPGIPIKILIPSLKMTLIDASRKKINFLKHMIRKLNMENIDVRHTRAEDFSASMDSLDTPIKNVSKLRVKKNQKKNKNFPPKFEVVTGRALSSLDKIVQLALPLTDGKGTIMALKGKITQGEIEAAKEYLNERFQNTGDIANFYSLNVERYRLPYTGSERSIVRINLNFTGRV